VIGSEARGDQTFQLVGGKLIKVTIVHKGPEFFCEDEIDAAVVGKALRAGNASPAFLSIQLSEATETDLLAAKCARPDQAHNADAWIKFLKENAEPPSE
jgi:hypothetical protein